MTFANKTKTYHKKSLGARLFRITRNILLAFFILSLSWVVIARFIPVFVTPLMFIRTIETLVDGEMPKNSKKWVSIDKISSHMVQAVIASEDNLFVSHHGFSFQDISKAIKHNKKGKRIRGGSTISQQTAKNVFLWPARSYFRKAMESYFTILIELIWPKKRIMEVYLNVAEMGNGVYGVEAASLEFFGVHSIQLTKSQAATIASCLPNPRKFHAASPSSYVIKRKDRIMNLMDKLTKVNFKKQTSNIENKKKRK